MGEIVDYKWEMVLLYWTFQNKTMDILDCNKFIEIYDQNDDHILSQRSKYESNLDIKKTMEYCRQLCMEMDNEAEAQLKCKTYLNMQKEDPNNDDINMISDGITSIIKTNSKVLSSDQYCSMARLTNIEQRGLLLEVIYQITSNAEPLQIFFTGPAGCGKTFTLKQLMELYNRFCQSHNSSKNAHVTCASTGKATVSLGGTIVHSTFRISASRKYGGRCREALHMYRSAFHNVNIVFVDEVSMVSSDILQRVHVTLQKITNEFEKPFGGMNTEFCGDLRQLPPVNAWPVYKPHTNSLSGAAFAKGRF
jgi:hypothetical protein